MKKMKFAAIVFAAHQIIILEAAKGNDCFDGMYFGAGIGGGFSEDEAKTVSVNEKPSNEKVSKSVNRFLGTLVFGSGKTTNANPFYCGGEIFVDFAKTHREDVTFKGRNMKMRHNGVVPSFGFRIGHTGVDTLFYGKIGLSHTKSVLDGRDANGNNENLTVAKIVPIVAIGLEKSVSAKWSARGDIEYRWKAKKTNSLYELENGHGINVRVMFLHHMKF